MHHLTRRAVHGRRDVLTMLGFGLAAAIGLGPDPHRNPTPGRAGVELLARPPSTPPPPTADRSTDLGLDTTGARSTVDAGDQESLPAFPPPRPGPPTVVSAGRPNGRQVALTIDDGTSEATVDAYVDFADRTGIALTFSPNGVNRAIWEPRATRIVRLVSTGQVQIANHTWSHRDCTRLSDADMARDIQQNEAWIEQTFGTTARPWFRPPFGSRTPHTDQVAAGIGYTNIVMWNGTLGDATVESPTEIVLLAERYLQPGTILLGHANHPPVTLVLDQLRSLIADRNLQPVTLDTMFGTSRTTG